MVQLDSVNYKATKDTEPMNVCRTFGQPECQRRGNKMGKMVTYIQESQTEMS